MTNRLLKALKSTALLFSAPRRFFRLRGFGVHSPFAFSFLANAIRQKHAYYAYAEINSLSSSRSMRKFLRRVFRIAVVLKTDKIAVFGPHRQLLLKTLALAGAHESDQPAMIVALSGADPGITLKCAESGGTVVLGNINHPAQNALLFNRLKSTASHGMTFTDGKTAIYVGRKDLPRQTFHIML